MVKITSKDIEILREYLDKLEVLEQEKPKNILTAEEWDEIFKSLFAFGEVPDPLNKGTTISLFDSLLHAM